MGSKELGDRATMERKEGRCREAKWENEGEKEMRRETRKKLGIGKGERKKVLSIAGISEDNKNQ